MQRYGVITAITVVLMAGSAFANVAPPVVLDPPATDNLAEPESSASPDRFIRSLYEVKLTAEAIRADLGRNTTSHIILYCFTPELLGLYKSAAQLDFPVIDGDMFMMSQEWDTKAADIVVTTKSQTGATATVEADFKTYDQDRHVTYTLKATKDGRWQIDNIAEARSGSVRDWVVEGLKDAAAQ